MESGLAGGSFFSSAPKYFGPEASISLWLLRAYEEWVFSVMQAGSPNGACSCLEVMTKLVKIMDFILVPDGSDSSLFSQRFSKYLLWTMPGTRT